MERILFRGGKTKDMNRIVNLTFLIISFVSCSNDTEISYFDTGEKKYEVPIRNGKYHGVFKRYYPDGTLAGEVNYLNGKKYGVLKGYDSSGYLMNFYDYKNDMMHGLFEVYHSKTENIRVKGYYKYDKPDSVGFEYYPSGELRRVYYYEMGELLYLKGFKPSGEMMQSKITAKIYPKDTLEHYSKNETLKVYIELAKRYSYDEGNKLWIITGNLDEKNNLLDTLENFTTDNGKLYFKYQTTPKNFGINYIMGKMLELKMPENIVIGETSFRYEYQVE
ncbi:MAG: hypothetical protein OEW67_14080 [Cyclobacteriaceae bacterium]|nr:hypothetical protein [Cyclobacteriaceae bacterium]